MARMHTSRKGKSGSARPIKKEIPKWVQYSKEEVEELVTQLHKNGHQPSIIGITLRDQHGIPSVKNITGESISQILKRNQLYPQYPEDLMNLMRKAVRLRKHQGNNKMDVHNKRSLHLTESKIRRLVRYYKTTNLLAGNWYYQP